MPKRRLRRIVSRSFLYSRLGQFVIGILVFLAVGGLRSAAQQPQLKRRSQETPQEKPAENKKAKKVKGPRAVGLLQLSGGKATLIPVAILVDGKFYDAGAYKADPIPMALESGTVYEAEQSGDSQGLFTIGGALHSKNSGSVNPWIGSGTYLPQGADAPKTTRKAEDVPVGINDTGDEPPRLTRNGTAKPAGKSDSSSTSTADGSGSADKSGATTPAQPASGSSNGSSTSTSPSSSSGSSAGQETAKAATPPVADKPAAQTNSDKGSGQTSASGAGAGQSPSSSNQTSSNQAASGQGSSGQATSGQADGDYYRPTLRRGKPTQAAPADEDDAATKKVEKTEAQTLATPPATAAVSASPVQMVAAISDAGGPEPQSYKFFWKTGEEDERRKQMLVAAGDEAKAYAAALAKNQILAHPVTPKTGEGRKAAAKQAQPVLENVQFRAFDLWLSGQPVLIISAEAHIPGASGVGASAEPYSVMLVARTDIYGSLRKLYSGVTDRFHLDVTPRLELIDVVDADGDGRGELLFRETSDAGKGYAIYRATPDRLWKMFDSLNAE
ncbi:MAG: hypothetical protein WB919_04975 [Candidatus Sulfotelmatobacter sp.]